MRMPYCTRPLRNVYLGIAEVIKDDTYLDMTDKEFIGACMKASKGQGNPVKFREIYFDLMEDAGLKPIVGPN